jgi:hypothetical protein
MEFRGRGTQTSGAPATQGSAHPTSAGGFGNGQLAALGGSNSGKLFKLASIALLFALTALIVAFIFFIAFGNRNQAASVRKDKFQAVFLNNGQVYFGNIKGVSRSSFDLQNIYYLQTSGNSTDATAASSSNVSLVKLGCELHAPYDQMIINSDQVLFWENIQDSSQVAKAIANYKKTNNSGQCSQSSQNSTQQAPSTSGQSTGQTTAPTPTPTPSAKKP